MQPTNITSNLTNIRDACWLNLQKQDRRTLLEETRRFVLCLVNNTQDYDGDVLTNMTEDVALDRLESLKCLVETIMMGQHEVNKSENREKVLDIFNNFEFNKVCCQTYREPEVDGCVVCLVAKFHSILIFTYNDTLCNDTFECSVSDNQIEEHLLNKLKCDRDICGNFTDCLRYCLTEITVNVKNCDTRFNTETIKFLHLPTAMRSNEEKTYFGIPLQQFGGTSGIIILSSIYVTGLILNCILIRIFIRHKEIRKDSKLIIINIAVADMLNLILHSPPIDIFLVNSIHSPLSVTYVFYVIIGLNIYSVMMFSCHVYLAVLPVNNRRTSGCKELRRYSPHAHALTAALLACVAPIPLISVIEEYYTVSLYVLITYCAVPLCCSTLFSVGTSLKLGLCVQNIHCGSAGSETQRTSRSRSANTLVALIVVSAVSYVPYCCLPFIPPYIGEQSEEHPFLIPWVFVWFNSFINPIALYVANGNFRRYFNRYICFCCCSGRE